MKKLLTILLALVAISGFAFAEDAVLVLSGSVQTGIQFQGDTTLGATANVWESNNGYPSSIWIDGTFAGTNAGGYFELFVSDLDTEKVGADALYGWWKPIPMITLSIGDSYGAAWTTAYEGWGSGGNGFQIKAEPITGLVVAVDYPFAFVTPVAFDPMALVIEAGYTLADIAAFGANIDLAGTYVGSVSVLAVKDLTAKVDFKYVADDAWRAEEYFAYAVAGATPYVWVYESALADDIAYDAAVTMAWGVKVGASYTISGVTPAAYFRYDSDATWHTGVNAGWTVEKNAIKAYADYNSDTTFDFGLRYIVSF